MVPKVKAYVSKNVCLELVGDARKLCFFCTKRFLNKQNIYFRSLLAMLGNQTLFFKCAFNNQKNQLFSELVGDARIVCFHR